MSLNFKNYIESNKVLVLAAEIAHYHKINTYIIGGVVRDLVLGTESKDIDFVVDGDGINFANLLAQKLSKDLKVNVFKTFGTAHFCYQNYNYEFVGARKESYQFDSRNPIVNIGSIDEDRLRRDFTINALSISLNKEDLGQLIDPFDGIGDLKKKIIKTPLDPLTTFNDDPLRMLRAIRFAAKLNFTIDKNCLSAIKKINHRIKIITNERICDELNKIILAPKPSIGFMLLHNTGLLNHILPELVALGGVEKVRNYAHKDVFLHTLEVLDNISLNTDNLWLRWAALLHDIGKPKTKKFVEGEGYTFHGHEVVGPRIAKKIFERLKLPLNDKLEYVQKIVNLHLRPISLIENDVTDSAIRRLLFDAGNDIDDLMLLCEADITSKNEAKVQRYLENFKLVREKLIAVEEKDKIRNWQPPISGEIVMETFNISPSKEVGIIKNAIREAILDGIVENDKDKAFDFMIEFAKSIKLFPKK